MNRFLILMLFSALMFSCFTESIDEPGFENEPPPGTDVYVPVYGDSATAFDIKIEPAKSIVRPAKIFTYNQFLVVNIQGEGFHVIDNSNPSIPRQLFFVKVPGSNDVAIKDGMIFSDNYSDIIAFRINENEEVEIVERISNVMNNQLFPPVRNVYFECVDPGKGIVLDWVLGESSEAKCYRP